MEDEAIAQLDLAEKNIHTDTRIWREVEPPSTDHKLTLEDIHRAVTSTEAGQPDKYHTMCTIL